MAGVAYSCVLPLLAMRAFYVIPMQEAYIGKHLFHPEFPAPTALWWIFCSFPIIALLLFFGKEKIALPQKAWSVLLAEVLLVAGIVSGIYFRKDPLEQAYRYDFYARQGQWQKIVDHAKVHSVHDMDALIYLNLALSHTGQFIDNFLQFPQKGGTGTHSIRSSKPYGIDSGQ